MNSYISGSDYKTVKSDSTCLIVKVELIRRESVLTREELVTTYFRLRQLYDAVSAKNLISIRHDPVTIGNRLCGYEFSFRSVVLTLNRDCSNTFHETNVAYG